jgi:hypothetical protein
MTSDDRREYALETTSWPTQYDRTPPEWLPALNAPEYLSGIDDRLSTLISVLNEFSGNAYLRRGVPLFDVTRYELLFNVADAWQCSDRIDAAYSGNGKRRVTWVTDRPRAFRSLREELTSKGMDFDLQPCNGPRRQTLSSRWRSLRNRVGAKVRSVVDEWRYRRPAPRRLDNLRPDVLFTDYYPNNVHAVLPLERRVREIEGLTTAWLPARSKVSHVLARHGIHAEPITTISAACKTRPLGFTDIERKRLSDLVTQGLEKAGPIVGLVDSRVIRRTIAGRISSHLEAAAWWLDIYDDAFRTVRPRTVVSTTYSSIVGRAAAAAARLNDAGSVYIQHGMIPADRIWFKHWIHDKALVWGEFDRRNFARWCDSKTQVEVIGAPLYPTKAVEQATTSARPPSSNAGKVVAYLASRTAGNVVSETLQKQVVRALANCMPRLGATLIVKPHPGDTTGILDALQREFGGFELVRSSTAQQVIQDSDVVVVVSSTTGLEACVAEKPLIVLTADKGRITVPYYEYGACLLATASDDGSDEGLYAALNDALESDLRREELRRGRRRLIDDMLNGADGRATECAADVLRALCRVGSS